VTLKSLQLFSLYNLSHSLEVICLLEAFRMNSSDNCAALATPALLLMRDMFTLRLSRKVVIMLSLKISLHFRPANLAKYFTRLTRQRFYIDLRLGLLCKTQPSACCADYQKCPKLPSHLQTLAVDMALLLLPDSGLVWFS